ncbi:MAG: adenylate/guanylate cyclase domain-containing protein, partial [Actinomycetota bacterium]|nr:adenylate/guanylate cyclase domain-containing protein [Actinomycetota bacterium]
VLDAAPAALLFAATYPERTLGLVLFNATARFRADDDYPEGHPDQFVESITERIRSEWGSEEYASLIVPSLAHDKSFARWYAKLMRAASSPRVLAETLRQTMDLDAREVLSSVQVPVLVMHSRDNALIPIAQGRYLAENLPDATFIELPGADSLILGAEMDLIIGHIEKFLTGARREPDPDRVLSTVLFTDIVGSTACLAEVGDRQWRHTLDAHDARIRLLVDSFKGRVAKTTGDGVLALFDGPGRALQCAFALRDDIAGAEIEMRTGIHTGEVEMRAEGDVTGIAVHIAARVMAHARPGDILVSRTVRDLVTGGGFSFESRGTYELKGVPDEWELCAAAEGNAVR